MLNSEIWKDIEGFEGRYQVSNLGRVRRADGRFLTPHINKSTSYFVVDLYRNTVRKKCYIHRLVAATFCRGYFEGATVNHLDRNRQNNCASNLEWCTQAENNRHARECIHLWKPKTPLTRKMCTAKTSKFYGVSWWAGSKQQQGSWTAQKMRNGKHLFVKRFPTEEEAARFYDEKILELGLDSIYPLNFPNQTETPNDYPVREYSQAAGNGSHPEQGC